MEHSLAQIRRTIVATLVLFFVVLVVRAGFLADGPWSPLEGVGLAVVIVAGVLPRLLEDYRTTVQEGISVALVGLVCFGIGALAARSDGGQVPVELTLAFVACLLVAAGFVGWSSASGREQS